MFLEARMGTCPEGIRQRASKAVRELWPGDQGLGLRHLEDTAGTMLTDVIPQTEHVEKRNPQTETAERACSLPR